MKHVITKTIVIDDYIFNWMGSHPVSDLKTMNLFSHFEFLEIYNSEGRINVTAHKYDFIPHLSVEIKMICKQKDNTTKWKNYDHMAITSIYGRKIIDCNEEDFRKYFTDLFINTFGVSSESIIHI